MSCRAQILAAIKEGKLPEMTAKEANVIIDDVDDIREFVGNRDGGFLGENFRKEVQKRLDQRRFERETKLMGKKEDILKNAALKDIVLQDKFKGAPDKAALAVILGGDLGFSKKGGKGIMPVANGLHANRMSGLYLKIKSSGLLDIAVDESGPLDPNTAQALYLMSKGREAEIKDPHAHELAKAYKATLDSALADKQAAGSFVREAKGYVARTTYDREKLIAIKKDGFRALIKEKIDAVETFGMMSEDKIDAIIDQAYDNIIAPIDTATAEAQGVNVAERQAQERTFIFKDGYAWHDVNKAVGSGNMLKTIISDSHRAARETAAIQIFGTNPELGYKKMKLEMKNAYRDDPKASMRLNEKTRDMDAAFNRATQFVDAPGASLFAVGARNARIAAAIAKTGSASLSTMSDLAFSVSRVMSQSGGKNIFGEVAHQMGEFTKHLANADARAEIGMKLGIILDDFSFELLDRHGVEAGPGIMSKSARMFQKINGMKYIDNAAASAGAKSHAMELAESAHLDWASLPDRQRLGREKHGFDANGWDLARQAIDTLQDGSRVINYELIRQLPDEAVHKIYGTDGVNPEKIRFQVGTSLLSIMNETADASASRSSPRVMHHLLGDSRDDGGWGTVRRIMMQFKSPILMNTRTMLDTVMSNPKTQPKNLKEAILNGKGDFFGFTQLFILASVLGYAKIVAQSWRDRKTAPDWKDPEIALKSMLNGGAASLYADFMFSELHRNYGQGAADMVLGPVAGEFAKILDTSRMAMRGEADWKDVWRLTWNNSPGHNLPYVKGALDYYIADEVNESLNPGYKAQLEMRAREVPGLMDDHQSYWMFQPTK